MAFGCKVNHPYNWKRGSRVEFGKKVFILPLLLLIVQVIPTSIASWDDWWTYDGISGTDFWGLLNPEWILCTKGRKQSPVNIDPDNLLFDPELKPLHVDQNRISGVLENNGHSVVFRLVLEEDQFHSLPPSTPSPVFHFSDSSNVGRSSRKGEVSFDSQDDRGRESNGGSGHHHLPSSSHHLHHHHHNPEPSVTMSGGPLSYRYNFDSIYLHFGRTDVFGSEHVVAGVSFPAELQMYGYNSDLYQNMSDALNKANGLAAISLLIQIGNVSNPELKSLLNPVNQIRFRGQNVTIKSISIHDLIPDHEFYMTYEGSMTIPGCQETVTWIIINKPIFITRQQGSDCPSMKTRLHYQVNSKHLIRP